MAAGVSVGALLGARGAASGLDLDLLAGSTGLDRRITLPHLDGSNPHSRAVTENATTVTWTVRATSPVAAVRVEVAADKAGTARTGRVVLRQP